MPGAATLELLSRPLPLPVCREIISSWLPTLGPCGVPLRAAPAERATRAGAKNPTLALHILGPRPFLGAASGSREHISKQCASN